MSLPQTCRWLLPARVRVRARKAEGRPTGSRQLSSLAGHRKHSKALLRLHSHVSSSTEGDFFMHKTCPFGRSLHVQGQFPLRVFSMLIAPPRPSRGTCVCAPKLNQEGGAPPKGGGKQRQMFVEKSGRNEKSVPERRFSLLRAVSCPRWSVDCGRRLLSCRSAAVCG
jgi:hypothetical protein